MKEGQKTTINFFKGSEYINFEEGTQKSPRNFMILNEHYHKTGNFLKNIPNLSQPVSETSPNPKKIEKIVQSKSSQLLITLQMRESSGKSEKSEKNILLFKDPSMSRINNKVKNFDNYLELPEDRLKLVVNQKILKMNQLAYQNIEKKLEYEKSLEIQRKNFILKNRKNSLNRLRIQQTKMKEKEAKTGIKKIRKSERNLKNHYTSSRLEYLSTPKTYKPGRVDDYLDCVGLISPESLEMNIKICESKMVKTPSYKKTENYCGLGLVDDNYKKGSEQSKNFISKHIVDREVIDSMKDLNEFHRIYGELKGRVGFPQIDLEKYKKSND